MLVTILRGKVSRKPKIKSNSDILECTAIIRIVPLHPLEISQGPLMGLKFSD